MKNSTFDLTSFKRNVDSMIATNDTAYQGNWAERNYRSRIKDYSREQVDSIIRSGSLDKQKALSRNYFNKDGFYKRIIIYYATLLKYTGMLIPNPTFGKKLSTPFIKKRYYNALNYLEKINVPEFCEKCALNALIDGSYYGLIVEQNKDVFAVLDLPANYCSSSYKDNLGNDLIEFDISYFNTLTNPQGKKEALKVYPKFISDYYEMYRTGKVSNKWICIPADIGICFPFFDGRPPFINIIPATIDYDEAIQVEKERDLEEIRKIIVQQIPHTASGELVFEPDEAEEMHRASVGMMKGNKNVSVLTTYADVEAITSKTSTDTRTDSLQKMMANIYQQGGVSRQIFGSDSNLSLESSIKNDMAMMMHLSRKFERFITNIINEHYANTNVNFKFSILPVSYYNDDKFIDTSLKLANAGYSFIMPAVAMGVSQRDLENLKELENDVLDLKDKLIPLNSAFTEPADKNDGGAPAKNPEEKAPKTVQNEKSLDKGGSN